MALRNIVQADRAIRLLSTVFATRQQLVDLTLQAPALLFLLLLCLIGKDEDISVGSKLILHGSSPIPLEHRCQSALDLIHEAHALEGHPHPHAIHKSSRHWLVNGLFIPYLLLLLWWSLSPLLVGRNLWLILRPILSLSALPLITSISRSFLLVIVLILFSLSLIRASIIIPIGIHAPKVGGMIMKDLIIIAIEAITHPILIIHKAIVIAIDLQIDVTVLHAKGIMVAIDGKSKGAVSDVDEIMIA